MKNHKIKVIDSTYEVHDVVLSRLERKCIVNKLMVLFRGVFKK